MEHLDRFVMKRKLQEKSTQYYWYNGVWNDEPENTEEGDSKSKDPLDVQEAEEKAKEPEENPKKEMRTELDSTDLVPGTLVIIQGYGTNNEPRKYMWNKSKGEILSKNPDGSYKVRITDVKDSNVLFSKKWYDKEQKALTQRLSLTTDEFKTLKELDNEAEKAEVDKENAEIEKAREGEVKAKEKEASDKQKAGDKAKKEAEKAKKKEEKSENIKITSRRLI